jgi:hypothetical protein
MTLWARGRGLALARFHCSGRVVPERATTPGLRAPARRLGLRERVRVHGDMPCDARRCKVMCKVYDTTNNNNNDTVMVCMYMCVHASITDPPRDLPRRLQVRSRER